MVDKGAGGYLKILLKTKIFPQFLFELFFEFMVDKGEGGYLKILLKTKVFPQFFFELFFEFMVDKGEGGYLIPPPVSIHSLQDEPHNTMQCMNWSIWIQNPFVHKE